MTSISFRLIRSRNNYLLSQLSQSVSNKLKHTTQNREILVLCFLASPYFVVTLSLSLSVSSPSLLSVWVCLCIWVYAHRYVCLHQHKCAYMLMLLCLSVACVSLSESLCMFVFLCMFKYMCVSIFAQVCVLVISQSYLVKKTSNLIEIQENSGLSFLWENLDMRPCLLRNGTLTSSNLRAE